MSKNTYKKRMAYLFTAVVFCLGLMISIFPQQRSYAATPEWEAVAYCRSKVGAQAPVPSYQPSTADLTTACAKGFLAGYKGLNKTNTCNAISLGSGLTGLYIPNGSASTGPVGAPQPTSPIPSPGLIPPSGGQTPTNQPNFGGDPVKVCKQSYDAGKNKVGSDFNSAQNAANAACNNTDPANRSKCKDDVQKCLNKPNKTEQSQCLAKIPDNYPPQSTDAAGDTSASCDGEGLSLGWIICGMTEVVSKFGQTIFSDYIQPMMENTPLSLEPDDPFYKSWQGFRFLGNILLIGSMLAIVYSQARGGGGGK